MPKSYSGALGALTFVALLFAFVGVSDRGFWTDELFTLFVIDHGGGEVEVWRRALTDTHPPLYYFLAHDWGVVFGFSEIPLRALSAVFASLAIGVWLVGAAPIFSLRARLFASSVMALSPWWLFQSQNARAYGLAMPAVTLLTVLLLRAKRADDGGKAMPAYVALLGAVGAVAAFVHFYAFLTVGLVLLAAIVSIRGPFARLALVFMGLVIAALEAAFVKTLMLHTQADFHRLWFGQNGRFFATEIVQALDGFVGPGALIALVVLVTSARRKGGANDLRIWSAKTGLLIYLGVLAIGVVVTFTFAPSFAQQNLQVANPLMLPGCALLWERGAATSGRSWPPRVATAALALQTLFIGARFLPYGEAWRESAAYVEARRGCAGRAVPVLLPALFGPPTPFYRNLAETAFYGRYLAKGVGRPLALTDAEIVDPLYNPNLRGEATCPVLAWAVHDIDEQRAGVLARRLAAAAGLSPGRVKLQPFTSFRFVWGFPVATRQAFVISRR